MQDVEHVLVENQREWVLQCDVAQVCQKESKQMFTYLEQCNEANNYLRGMEEKQAKLQRLQEKQIQSMEDLLQEKETLEIHHQGLWVTESTFQQ